MLICWMMEAEASEPKENALAAAERNSSGRSEGKEMGKSVGGSVY